MGLVSASVFICFVCERGYVGLLEMPNKQANLRKGKNKKKYKIKGIVPSHLEISLINSVNALSSCKLFA